MSSAERYNAPRASKAKHNYQIPARYKCSHEMSSKIQWIVIFGPALLVYSRNGLERTRG